MSILISYVFIYNINMPTKPELMTFMKKYKAENCKPISTLNKDELYTEAKKHGFLHEKHGLKKKTKSSAAPAPAAAPAAPAAAKPAAKPAAPKASGMTRKEIFQKIKDLEKKDMVNMTSAEAKAISKERLKLFEMLKNTPKT